MIGTKNVLESSIENNIGDVKERSCERVDYDQFLPRNGLFGSLQRFLNH